MAKKFVDAASTDVREALSVQDGTALTLTNEVRVLYDDTVDKSDLVVALEKARDKIIQDLG